jgi:hypothetical protein
VVVAALAMKSIYITISEYLSRPGRFTGRR